MLNPKAPTSVIIIGAGIIGLSCAVQLQAKGIKVKILNKNTIDERASSGHAGLIAACACVPLSTPGILVQAPKWLLDPLGPLSLRWTHLPKLTAWGLRFVLNSRRKAFEHTASSLAILLEDALELHLKQAQLIGANDLIRAKPYYYLYRDDKAFQNDYLAWQIRRQFGIQYDLLVKGQIHQLEPDISPLFNFAVKLHNHGFTIEPSKLLKKLESYFISQGGEILTETVKSISSGQQGVKVTTDNNTHNSNKVVVAAGIWSEKLVRSLGDRVNIQGEGGYYAQVRNPNIRLQAPIMFSEGKMVATPMQNGDIRFAGLVELAGLNAPMNTDFCERLLTHAKKLFPGINTSTHTKWHGYRPSTADSLPVIGYSPNHTKVIYAFGHQHLGFTLAPRTGKIITQLLTQGHTDIDLTPYRIERFMK